MMFDHLIEENGVMKYFKYWGLNETDLIFIKEMIAGPATSESVIALHFIFKEPSLKILKDALADSIQINPLKAISL